MSPVEPSAYRYELARAVASGVIETAAGTFLLLIAVRAFDASAISKGWIAAGSGLGYLLTPVTVAAVRALGLPASTAASRLALTGALMFGAAALFPWLPLFVIASVAALACAGAMMPLLTQIYQDSYPAVSRGRFFSRTVMVRIVAATAFSAGAGYLLTLDLGYFRALLGVFAVAFAFSAWCLGRISSRPLHVGGGGPLRMFRFTRTDRVFRVTLVSWMFLGFGNLMMVPLRVEYLANPRYGLVFEPGVIALLTGVVPNLARLAMSPLWGRLFDRANFFVLRMTLNAGFAVGILSFFTSDGMTGLVVASLVLGVSTAGSDVAWSLWVTKVAPPEHVADYMSVHTFLTGVRGLVAPLMAFALVARWSITGLGLVAAASIAAAIVILIPEARRGPALRAARATPVAPPLPADEGEP
jgi:hypothetical protein